MSCGSSIVQPVGAGLLRPEPIRVALNGWGDNPDSPVGGSAPPNARMHVAGDRLYQCAHLGQESEAFDVWIYPQAAQIPAGAITTQDPKSTGRNRRFRVSGRAPLVTPFRGPLAIEPCAPYLGETGYRHFLDLWLFEYTPLFVPNRRADIYHTGKNAAFSTASETTIARFFARGRAGQAFTIRHKTWSGSSPTNRVRLYGIYFDDQGGITDHPSAVVDYTADSTNDNDVSRTWHLEGRYDAYKLTYLAGGTTPSVDVWYHLHLRDEL